MTFAAVSSPAVGDQTTAAWGSAVAGDLNGGPNMGTPRATAANGTLGTAAETRDAVLGDYTFTAVADRRYRAVLDGLFIYGSTANNQIGVRIRNGGASTPTNASPLVAESRTVTGLAAAAYTLPVAGTFVPGAGDVTLSAFTIRIVGSGAGETPTGARELYAVDVGPA
jgi:hypothetical protein